MMPFGLITKTWPLACNVPYIWEGFAEKTRFSATAFAEGWTNFVTSPKPIEKSCQLMMTLLALWLIVVDGVPWPVIVALPLPPTTVPPTGLAPDGNVKLANA